MNIINRNNNDLFGEIGGRIFLKILLGRLLSLFRINSHKYFCISMGGKSYGCNIKSIADCIKIVDPKATIIWAFTPQLYNQLKMKNSVKLMSWSYYRHLVSSHYILSNMRLRLQYFPIKQKGQIYLQTWHGTPMKFIENDAKNLHEVYVEVAKADSKKIDAIVSGSEFMTKLFKDSFWYNGQVFETGTPRNDIFFKDNSLLQRKIKSTLNIPQTGKIVLYAPSFRTNLSFNAYSIDVHMIKEILENKTKEQWYIVTRMHPHLLREEFAKEIVTRFPNCINATSYPDMQELLSVADILITDFSSSMFDFMYTGRPCFLYVSDIKDYDRGFYFIWNELPFPLSENNEELKKNILNFDAHTYKTQIELFKDKIGSKETGNASIQAAQLLISLSK